MLGWYIDEIVVYLARRLLWFLRERRSEKWPKTEGQLLSARDNDSIYPVAEVVYAFNVDGSRRTSTDERPFFWRKSARNYAATAKATEQLVVRFDPSDPTNSIARDRDQIYRRSTQREYLMR